MAGKVRDQAAGLQEMLRKLAMVHEGFVQDKARLEFDLARASALDPKTAALIVVGVVVAIGAAPACLRWSAGRALAAGASADEITGVLLAIAPVAGLGRVVGAAPGLAAGLGYDLEAALMEIDDP
jgi:4-carboxymuconolactone decarboxylase